MWSEWVYGVSGCVEWVCGVSGAPLVTTPYAWWRYARADRRRPRLLCHLCFCRSLPARMRHALTALSVLAGCFSHQSAKKSPNFYSQIKVAIADCGCSSILKDIQSITFFKFVLLVFISS